MKDIRIWDLPTRVFHWMLALAVVGSVVTAKLGGNAMVWHFRLGYLIAALLIFRLVWGVIGGRWSRFVSFVYSPSTVVAYLRGNRGPHEVLDVGHSPVGALSVFAVLGVLAAQVLTGLVADDEIANTGPLSRYVSAATTSWATGWHAHWGQYLIIALVLLHVLAIVVYALKGKRLVPPMIHGDKRLSEALAQQVQASQDTGRTRLIALAVGVVAGGIMAWVSRLG